MKQPVESGDIKGSGEGRQFERIEASLIQSGFRRDIRLKCNLTASRHGVPYRTSSHAFHAHTVHEKNRVAWACNHAREFPHRSEDGHEYMPMPPIFGA